MIRKLVLGVVALACASTVFAGLNTDWAYHDDNDGTDDRATEYVPAKDMPFIGNGKVSVPNDQVVTLYVLTANQFAGDLEEQVFVRWWNGEQEHWIMGSWVDNVYLGTGETDAGRFHGLPMDAPVMLDLWKFEIGADITKPGENFYVIQLKGWSEGGTQEVYLLRDASDESSNNNVGQANTSGSYFGHDWSVKIEE